MHLRPSILCKVTRNSEYGPEHGAIQRMHEKVMVAKLDTGLPTTVTSFKPNMNMACFEGVRITL